jgi:hypothetical protein
VTSPVNEAAVDGHRPVRARARGCLNTPSFLTLPIFAALLPSPSSSPLPRLNSARAAGCSGMNRLSSRWSRMCPRRGRVPAQAICAERIDASDIWISVLPEGQLGRRPLAPADEVTRLNRNKTRRSRMAMSRCPAPGPLGHAPPKT